MPDLATRAKHERKLASAVAGVFRDHREKYLESGRLAPRKIESDVVSSVTLVLLLIYLDGAGSLFDWVKGQSPYERLLEKSGNDGSTFTADHLQERARQVALKYAETLGRRVAVNTVDQVAAVTRAAGGVRPTAPGQSIAPGATGPSGKAAPGAPVPTRQEVAAKVFGRDRAEGVGITETTRAISAGELEAKKYVEKVLGVRLVPVWVTARDRGVCPVCRPHDGVELSRLSSLRNGPPAHPRCRCFIRYEIRP